MSAAATQRSESVMLLCPGDPSGPRTGRINVLETAVKSLSALGLKVTVIALTSQSGPDTWLGRPLFRVPPPRRAELLVSAARTVARGHTLNEAVMDSPGVRRRVREVATECRASLIVASGMRVWPVAESLDLPVICHLDDLLSSRYASPEFVDGNDSVLGYYGDELHPQVRRPAEWAARRLLRWEGRRAFRRERTIATQAAAVAMTSAAEADELARRAKRPVLALPMAVEAREPGDPASADDWSAVFLGVLHYGPNLAALRHLRDEVFPILRADGISPQLTVVGACDEKQRHEFEAAGFTMAGYVEDLGAALRGHRMFLSPILSGTGVKTKVLDGMSVALPVVATSCGIAGVPAEHGRHALVADDTAEFADAMRSLADSPEHAAAIGTAGRTLLRDRLSADTVVAEWARALDQARRQP